MLQQLVTDIVGLKKILAETKTLRHHSSQTEMKALRRSFKTAEDIPAAQIELAETQDHRGFEVRVYKRLDVQPPYVYQPVILKDGKVVRQIFVRSKTIYVSMEHFGKRAADHFIKTGQWPEKQGATVAAVGEK